MTRDNDLALEMLLEIEAGDEPCFSLFLSKTGSDEERRRFAHLLLCADDGLLQNDAKNGGRSVSEIFCLTNTRHDLDEAIRDHSRWDIVKGAVSPAGGATLGVLFEVSKEMLKNETKKHAGLGGG